MSKPAASSKKPTPSIPPARATAAKTKPSIKPGPASKPSPAPATRRSPQPPPAPTGLPNSESRFRPTALPLTVRGRLWLESSPGKSSPRSAALTEAGADLLDQIAVCGSLSEAARRLRYSYRRAWLLVDAMNTVWPTPLVITTTGGNRGGGARLTERGKHVLAAYRDLQLQLEHLLGDTIHNFHLPGE